MRSADSPTWLVVERSAKGSPDEDMIPNSNKGRQQVFMSVLIGVTAFAIFTVGAPAFTSDPREVKKKQRDAREWVETNRSNNSNNSNNSKS
ncbi:hypothetical protein BC829DRAFT_440551 [Chytridium lagenaria]|nr:hypothetical protein BC829DRAFT_440551 [Chytridium lagenaria]